MIPRCSLVVVGSMVCLLVAPACDDESSPSSPDDGGNGGAASGGSAGAATGGARATGGQSGSQSGGASSGGSATSSGGTAASGGGGATHTGGASSTGGASNTGGSTGTGGEGSGGAVGGSGGAGPCKASKSAVCVAMVARNAAFLDADGAVLAEGRTPIAHEVPAGGSVLTQSAFGSALHFDVPPGSVIADEPVPPPPQPDEPVQSIQVDIPEAPNPQFVLTQTGCRQQNGAARGLIGAGVKTFEMTRACLDGGVAAVLAIAGDAYIYVPGVTLGAANLAPKVVPLPAWKTVTSPTPFNLLNMPAGFDARVTYRARWGGGELASAAYGVDITAGTGSTSIALPQTAGKEWRRFIQVNERGGVPTGAFTYSHVSLGLPLPASESTSAVVDLLPMAENLQISGRTVSWSFPRAVTGADRIFVNVTGPGASGDTTLRIIAAPARTSVKVPATLPPAFATSAVNTIRSAGVFLEDLSGIGSYAASLAAEPFLLTMVGDFDDRFGRQSFRILTQ
jgi:hypothetical protein